MASKIIALNWKENNIAQRESDGYVNLTQMCKANKVLIGHYLELKSTKAYLTQVSTDIGIPISEIMVVKKGGNKDNQGTWGHPLIGLHLARWISPAFAVWCDSHIFVLMEKGETNLGIDPFTVMQSIIEEKRTEYSQLAEIDERFLEITDYAHWSR